MILVFFYVIFFLPVEIETMLILLPPIDYAIFFIDRQLLYAGLFNIYFRKLDKFVKVYGYDGLI